MAKRTKKVDVITVAPEATPEANNSVVPTPAPTPDLSGIGDALSGDDSRSVNATPEATPAPTPTPAPFPCEIIPVSALPTPAPVQLPEFTDAAAPFVAEFNTALDSMLATVGTAEYVRVGRVARSVMIAEFNATPAGKWTDSAYDNVLSSLRDQYILTRPNVNPVYVRVGDFMRCADFVDGCVTLGIVDPERLAYGLIVNFLAGATRTVVKGQGVSVAREGWADWTRKVVPMYLDGSISRESVIASIDAQKLALHNSDPKKYAKPPVKKIATPAAPVRSSTPVVPIGLGMAVAPTPASKPNATPAPSNPPTPATKGNTTPAAPVAPVASNPTPAPFDATALVKSLNPSDFASLATALAKVGSDDQIIVAYKAIATRVKEISERAAQAQKRA